MDKVDSIIGLLMSDLFLFKHFKFVKNVCTVDTAFLM